MSEDFDLTQLYEYVVQRTGQTELWSVAREILDEQKRLLELVDKPSGLSVAENELTSKEKELIAMFSEKADVWSEQLKTLDRKRRADIEKADLDRVEKRRQITDPELARMRKEIDDETPWLRRVCKQPRPNR